MASNEQGGVWRTIGGRRVFIKDGQSLSEAMIESGKFKNLRSDYRKAKEEMAKENAPQGAKTKELIEETKTKTFADEIKEKEDKERLEIAKDIAKEVYGKNMGDELLERKAKEILEPQEGEVLEKGDEPYTNAKGELERSTKYLKEWQKQLKGQEKTNSNDEYELYKKAKENPDSIDPMTENSTDWEALESKYKDRYENKTKKALGRGLDSLGNESADGEGLKKMFGKENKDGFTQKTDMYGGTREYSKEQLDKMEQHGTKPMEHSYTGGGWEGTKYDSKLSTKDIAKNINDYAKKEFPDVKLSRKTDYNGIDIHVMSSGKDLYASASDIDKMSDKQVSDTIRDSIGGYTRMDDWLNANNRKSANGTFTTKDERDYLKEQLNTYKSRKGDNVSGNEWYLSDYGKKVISGLNKEMNSYNYDDSDGMVDYFNTNFYGYVKIGKWDKPYEVSESKSSGNQISSSLQQKAYQKYMKEHPGSKMSFEDFKKQK